MPSAAPQARSAGLVLEQAAVLAPGVDWVCIPYVLQLDSPVNVSARTVGNVVETLDFVPGTFLLPRLTEALAALGVDARPWIASGSFRVLPATVEIDGRAGRPVPLALHYEKERGRLDQPDSLRNRLLQEAQELNNDDRDQDRAPEDNKKHAQLKQCREGYLGEAQSGQMPRHAKVNLIVRTHNTIDEESQRPTEAVGGVYSYEAIAAPCRLRGEIRLRRDLAAQWMKYPTWRSAVEGPCRLGRSKKDDYGAATLTLDLPEGAEPTPLEAPPACQDGRLFVWVLSDVLLRDQRLRFCPTAEALGEALQAALGVRLTVERAFTRIRRIDSWNTAWGLPRPSLVALQAGSCVLFRTEPAPAVDSLKQIEGSGIGERTAEGYGQLRFNDPLITGDPMKLQQPKSAENNKSKGDERVRLSQNDPNYKYAQQLEEVVWRDRIRRKALEVAHDEKRRQDVLHWSVDKDMPPTSQLGALRTVVQQVRSWTERAVVHKWLEHLKEIKRRKEKWPCQSLKVLDDLFQHEDRIWCIFDPQEWPALTDGVDALKKKLWDLAVRSLIDAAFQAHKRELDQRRRKTREN